MCGVGRFASILLVTLAAAYTHAQSTPPAPAPTIIESEGTASVEAAPDEAHFELAKNFDGPTLIDAAAQALAFEKAVTQALHDLDLSPLRQEPLRMQIPGLRQTHTAARVALIFALPAKERATPAGAGSPPLAALAEKIRKAAVSLSAEPAFTGFGVKDHAPAEQDAVARASENALYRADAVGGLIGGRVIGVERIAIVETGWDGLEAREGVLPIPPALRCHARVRISYQYSSSNR